MTKIAQNPSNVSDVSLRLTQKPTLMHIKSLTIVMIRKLQLWKIQFIVKNVHVSIEQKIN
jgi:hypothetical protein